jgi:hypothetical protein
VKCTSRALLMPSTPFLKVGHGVKNPIGIHSNGTHLSSSMMELLASCWISTSFVWSLLISCQSENLRAQKSTSHITKSLPWLNEGNFQHACAIVDAIMQFGTQTAWKHKLNNKNPINSNFGFSHDDNVVLDFKCWVHLSSPMTNIAPYSYFHSIVLEW